MGKLANPKIGRERAAMADAIRALEYGSDSTKWVTFKNERLLLGADNDHFDTGYAIIANRGKYQLVWVYDKDGFRASDLPGGISWKIQYTQVRAIVLERHRR